MQTNPRYPRQAQNTHASTSTSTAQLKLGLPAAHAKPRTGILAGPVATGITGIAGMSGAVFPGAKLAEAVSAFAALARDPATPDWLRQACHAVQDRDPVKAAAEAEELSRRLGVIADQTLAWNLQRLGLNHLRPLGQEQGNEDDPVQQERMRAAFGKAYGASWDDPQMLEVREDFQRGWRAAAGDHHGR